MRGNLTETAGNAVEQDFYGKLVAIVNEDRIQRKELLGCHTTFRIGGPADYFVCVKEEELAPVIALCKREGMPCFLIGNGSNLLVSDTGYRGTVIKLCQTKAFSFEDQGECLVAHVGAGVALAAFAREVAARGGAGFAFAAGIPGSVGGAIYMNAGAYGGEIADFFVGARVLLASGEIAAIKKEELRFSYRSSILQQRELYVLSADFCFPKGEARAEQGRIEELAALRREKQPLEFPSAGSTFKRPAGLFAGKLIMEAGLAGCRVGGAKVAEKHCGFVVNDGNATAADVAALIARVQDTVWQKHGVRLEPEIQFLGRFA
ncbi:MAG: UDP-N-acetylmuramate dehydrogenase [Lachnospiraceae bacterium]|nr:UDP-N-acetylmuramate dehydrogenase [Lachnospiraceae bacterium]